MDQAEATLDVTRASSVAPGATILLVVSANIATTSGLSWSSQYVVDTNPVPAYIMNISFGNCEARWRLHTVPKRVIVERPVWRNSSGRKATSALDP
jgi:subtilase family serine protease